MRHESTSSRQRGEGETLNGWRLILRLREISSGKMGSAEDGGGLRGIQGLLWKNLGAFFLVWWRTAWRVDREFVWRGVFFDFFGDDFESGGSSMGKNMESILSKDLRGLLRDFLNGGDRERVFQEITGRLSGLIYHAAYRQSGDVALSEEVTQNVLVQVSRKAGKLVKHAEILAWVHEATRLEVLQMRRANHRRKKREEIAMREMKMEQVSDSHLLADLDESLRVLNSSERELVLMRFFEGRTFLAIASETGRSETAEKKRLKKALEKMAAWFGKKGVALSVVGLTTVLSTEIGKAAPVGLVLGGSGGEVMLAGGLGSGKLAAGVSMLMAAGLAVPVVSSWGEVRELEKELETLNRSEVTRSARSGRSLITEGGVGRIRRMAQEKVGVDEVIDLVIRVGAFGNILQEEVLKSQLELLELDELVEVATRLHAREGRGVGSGFGGDRLVLKELRRRLEPMLPSERLEFLIPLRISILAARDEFREWVKVSPVDEIGKWLHEKQGFLEKHMWGYALQRDLKGKMWRVYLSKLAAVKLDDGIRELGKAPVSIAHKRKWLNDLASKMGNRGFEKHEETILQEYRRGEEGLRYQWGKVIMRLIGDDDLEEVHEWMIGHQFEEEERMSFLRMVFRNLHPDLKRKSFSERVDWLQRNLLGEEWGELVNSEFVRNYDTKKEKAVEVEDNLAEGFDEVLSVIAEGDEREALIVAAVSLMTSSWEFSEVGVAKAVGLLSQIRDESKRSELVRKWLGQAKLREPEMVPDIEGALLEAKLNVEGVPE